MPRRWRSPRGGSTRCGNSLRGSSQRCGPARPFTRRGGPAGQETGAEARQAEAGQMVSRSPPPFARMSAITCWAPANGRGGGAVAGGLQLAAKTVGEASFQGRRVPFSWDPLDLAGGEGGIRIVTFDAVESTFLRHPILTHNNRTTAQVRHSVEPAATSRSALFVAPRTASTCRCILGRPGALAPAGLARFRMFEGRPCTKPVNSHLP